MSRIPSQVLCALALLVAMTSQAFATFANYSSYVTTGSAVVMSSPTALYTGAVGSRNATATRNHATGFNIPFTFVLDGVSFNRVSVSTNGLMSLGSNNCSTTGSNSLTSTSSTYGQFPRIAAWWDQLYVTGGATRYCSGKSPAIRYQIFGTAPNRYLVVDFRDLEVASRTAAYSSWQVRLYETSNAIEFYYGNMTSLSCKYTTSRYSTFATIGIADASSDYLSVTPSGASATFSTTSAYNSVNLNTVSHRIPPGTLYRFAPCNISLAGNGAEGGTVNMMNGDTLFAATQLMRGSMQTFQPFAITNPTSGCATRTYSMAIGGVNASDYSLTTTIGSITQGSTVSAGITFNPQGVGLRRAVLTVADNNGFIRTYQLAATALPRISRIADILQGGTLLLANNDTLMSGILVRRGTFGDLTPITLQNINLDPTQQPANVSFTIDSAGAVSRQYEIVGSSSSTLAPGASFTPVIRFNAMGVSTQDARLTVNADGEVLTYTLRATSNAPAIEMFANGVAADPANPVFNNTYACVGDVLSTVPVIVANIGTMPLAVNDFAVYQTDTVYRQGPALPLVRDARGKPIRIRDYVLSEMPGTIPLSATPAAALPLMVEPGTTRTLYLTYVGQETGKRFGRAFIRTNGENVFGQDTAAFDNVLVTPTITEGLLAVDLLGRAIGSRFAANSDGLRVEPLTLPNTRIGDTTDAAFTIANAGACDLRIRQNRFRISSGDVNDIKVINTLRNSSFDASTGDFIIAPGVTDTVHIRFTPSRSGTRRATLWIQTNDSTIATPGITERGAYYVDINGRGLAGLDSRDLVLNPVAIGSFTTGVAVLENSQTAAVFIAEVAFAGDDAAEFSEEAIAAWPARPFPVLPGEKLRLGVRMTPLGAAGMRRTTLVLVSTSGDTIRVPIRGEAGTQSLTVSPSSMFEDITIGVGQSVRQPLMISNTGTLPVQIASVTVTGIDAANYLIGKMPRLSLEPGQTEYVEVTFAPALAGQSSGAIDIVTSTGELHSVVLGGSALRVRRDPSDPTISTGPSNHSAARAGRHGSGGATLR